MAPRRVKDQRRERPKGAANAAHSLDRRVKDRRAHNREFNYVLQIRDHDLRLIKKYQDILSRGVASFAEVYYNYLFDHPFTAEALYNCERKGGNISEFVRAQLHEMTNMLSGSVDEANARDLLNIGRLNHRWGMGPVWVLGAMRLYLEHLQQLLVAGPQVDPDECREVASILAKLVYRAVGVMMQGYWEATLETVESERARASPEYLQLIDVLGNIPLVVWSVDVPGLTLAFTSPATRNLCTAEVSGPIPCLDRVREDDRERVSMAWEQALAGRSTHAQCRADLGIGGERSVRFIFSPFRNDGRVVRVDALLEDRTEDQEAVARLEHIATTDGLTGLANRVLWEDRLERALSACRRNGALQAVVMILDLNQFKDINDTYGHAAGDQVLRQVAARLGGALRESDTIARLGGDEFAVLLPAVEGARKAAERVASKLLACLQEPVIYQDNDFHVSTAIGIAIAPEHGEAADLLVKRADLAMYRAKQADLPHLFFHPESDVSSSARVRMTKELQQALADNQFQLYYQPKVETSTTMPCGAEALLRWKHPEQGLVLPDGFLATAERIGLLKSATGWVLATALRRCKEWLEKGLRVPIAVNISGRAFQDPALVEKVQNALRETAMEGELLELEITEDTLMADLAQGGRTLSMLAGLGVRIAVDDFGTGYSSLSCLKDLSLHALKIDRSFLSDIADNGGDTAIVRSIIELGHNLGCQVVAEGVEDKRAWDLIAELGCDQVQGFHISHPLSGQGCTHWLAEAEHLSDA